MKNYYYRRLFTISLGRLSALDALTDFKLKTKYLMGVSKLPVRSRKVVKSVIIMIIKTLRQFSNYYMMMYAFRSGDTMALPSLS